MLEADEEEVTSLPLVATDIPRAAAFPFSKQKLEAVEVVEQTDVDMVIGTAAKLDEFR